MCSTSTTFRKNLLQRNLLFPLMLLGFFISLTATAHNVNSYTKACETGPKYKVDAQVSAVQSNSNYAWQYKKGSSWVCIVNGNNTINSNVYSVSGANSSGLDPAPIVFGNANSALNGLVIRCIIADGANVNPCNTSATIYNTSSGYKYHTVDVANTPCGQTSTNVLSLGSQVWYDTNNDGQLNSGENGILNLTVSLYKDADNNDVPDGTAVATDVTDDNGLYLFTNLAPGNYIVGVARPTGYISSNPTSADPDNNVNWDNNGSITAGNETRGKAITLSTGQETDGSGSTTTNINNTYDFAFIPDCSCTTGSSNMLTNGSFENGTTGWSWIGGGVNFTTGDGYVACGTKNGFNSASGNSGTAYVYQEFPASEGVTYTFKGFAGTHTAGLNCNPRLNMTFRRADGSNIVDIITKVTRDVDANHNQLEQYTVTGTAPAGTVSMRVHGAIDCNTLKMDAFCLTATNVLQLGSRVWYDANNDGIDNNENGIAGLTVRLYKDANNDNTPDGAAVATDVTDANGYYSFTGLAAGNYVVGVVTPNGYMRSGVNGGDPDNNINYDNNGVTIVGNETRGLAITLTPGAEPNENGNFNPSYDFGLLPDCSCTTSSNNMLVNGSFEDGTTGWHTGNSNFTTGTGYVACGTKNGFNDALGNGTTAYVFQEFSSTPGVTYTFKGFAGTHTAGLTCNPRLVMTFRRADGSNITELVTKVTRDVDVNHNQLEQYTVTGTAPAGTVSMRVHGAIDCNTLKMDAFCLTSDCATPATPTATVTQPTCSVATGTVVLNNLPAGSWTLFGTANGTPFSFDGVGSTFTQNDVAPGTYIYKVKISGGCTSAAVTTVVNNQPKTPTAPVAIVTQTVCGGNVGAVLLTGLPANDTWTISQSKNNATATTINGSGTSYLIRTLMEGTYTYTVKNSDGCTSPATQVVLNKPTAIYSVSGLTWNDANKNGRQDAGEALLSNVQVKLFKDIDANSIAEELLATVNTNGGRYSFPNLCPGSYVVSFGTVDGFARTIQLNTVPTAADNDSDPNQTSGVTNTINLTNGSVPNINAGYYEHTILPVSFGTITAQARNCEVALSFEVLTQKNTKQFEIQSSKDGSNWDKIGVVAAKASSNSAYKYSFMHTQPIVGVNMYRIKVVDTDGKISYSQVMSATSVCAGKGQITTYPNPAFDQLNVSLPTTYQDAQLQLFNGTGQLVVSDVKKAGLVRTLNTSSLTPGIYLLKVIYNNNVVMTQKVVKGE